MKIAVPVLSIIPIVMVTVFLSACDNEKPADGNTTPSVRDSMNVVLSAVSNCVSQGNPIVIHAAVTRLSDDSPGQQIPIHVMVRIYWWISCSQGGLSEWFLEKTATATTGADGTCEILLNFGASEFPGATFQHIDEIKLTN